MNRWLAIFAASCAIAVFGVLFDWIHAAGAPNVPGPFPRAAAAPAAPSLPAAETAGIPPKVSVAARMASAQRRRLTRSATLVLLVGRVAIRFANAIRPA